MLQTAIYILCSMKCQCRHFRCASCRPRRTGSRSLITWVIESVLAPITGAMCMRPECGMDTPICRGGCRSRGPATYVAETSVVTGQGMVSVVGGVPLWMPGASICRVEVSWGQRGGWGTWQMSGAPGHQPLFMPATCSEEFMPDKPRRYLQSCSLSDTQAVWQPSGRHGCCKSYENMVSNRGIMGNTQA